MVESTSELLRVDEFKLDVLLVNVEELKLDALLVKVEGIKLDALLVTELSKLKLVFEAIVLLATPVEVVAGTSTTTMLVVSTVPSDLVRVVSLVVV